MLQNSEKNRIDILHFIAKTDTIILAFWQGLARRLLPLRLPVALFIPPLTKWGTFWRHCTVPVRWR